MVSGGNQTFGIAAKLGRRAATGAVVGGATYSFVKQRSETYTELLQGEMTKAKLKTATMQNASGVLNAGLSAAPTAVGAFVAVANVARFDDKARTAFDEGVGMLPGGQILADVIEARPNMKTKKEAFLDVVHGYGHDHATSVPQGSRALMHNLTDQEIRNLLASC